MNKPVRFGKYYLLDRISTGGMAEVFRAKAHGAAGFAKLIAIKRILPHLARNVDFTRMFIDEAKIAGQLHHANIGQIYDLGKIGADLFIAMEYIHGKDLRQLAVQAKREMGMLPIPAACYIAARVCEALDYAHRKRDISGEHLFIVHRDVSPQNVLLSYEGEVKLIDFGIAKATSKAMTTQAGTLKGKFGYMSPEQVRGLPIDRRSDIFALGVLLYEILTGVRAFAGDTDFETLEKVRHVELAPPRSINDHIPKELEDIILKALAREVEDRYQYASEFMEDLQRFSMTTLGVYSGQDLSALMMRLFEKDFTREKILLERFLSFTPPAPGATPPPLPAVTAKEVEALSTDALSSDADTLVAPSSEITPVALDDEVTPGAEKTITGPMGVGAGRGRPEEEEPSVVGSHPYPLTSDLRRIGMAATAVAALGIAAAAFIFLGRQADLPQPSISAPASSSPAEPVGGIQVESTPPGAAVQLDGKPAGDTTFLKGDLEVGIEHRVVVTKVGFQPWEQRFTLRAGSILKMNADLVPLPLKLHLTTRPPGAMALIDGKRRGKTPLTLTDLDPSKSHQLVLKRKGYQSVTRKLAFDGGGEKNLEVPLQRKATRARRGRVKTTARLQKAAPGYLSLDSKPWTFIAIDGADIDRRTPLKRFPLSPGLHTITLTNDRLRLRKTLTVHIKPGETEVVNLTLH